MATTTIRRRQHWRAGRTAMVLEAACRGLLAMIVSLLVWSVLPVALGWHVTVVMSGSMEPLLHPGDVVASRPINPQQVRIGQVLLVNDPDHAGRLRLHRLAIIRPDGMLTLRGDANAADDSTPVSRSAVRGVGSLMVPMIGLPAYWARTGQLGRLAGGTAVLGLVVAGSWLRRDEDDDPDHDADDGTGSEYIGKHWPKVAEVTPRPSSTESDIRRVAFAGRGVRLAGVGVLTVGLVSAGIATGPSALATPFGAKTSTASTWAAASAFSGCSPAVMTDKPYAYYPLTESSGTTAADASGNGNSGTYSSGVTHTSGGGPCSDTPAVATFNGSGMVSTSQKITLGSSFTEEIWFNTSDNKGGALIGFAATPSGTVSDPQLYINNPSRPVFEITTSRGAVSIAGSNKVKDGGWHLATATFSSSGGMQLYIDGSLLTSNSSATTMISTSGYLQMGNGFNGSLSGAAYFPTALSAAQVKAEYQAASS